MRTAPAEGMLAVLTFGRLVDDFQANRARKVLVYRLDDEVLLANESLHRQLSRLAFLELLKEFFAGYCIVGQRLEALHSVSVFLFHGVVSR